MKELINIKYWIFDLDNTLYSGQTQVFSEVDKKMSAFISQKMNVDLVKAKEIQKKYFYEYGTTLSGLMKQDGICLLYTSPSPRDRQKSRMPSSA